MGKPAAKIADHGNIRIQPLEVLDISGDHKVTVWSQDRPLRNRVTDALAQTPPRQIDGVEPLVVQFDPRSRIQLHLGRFLRGVEPGLDEKVRTVQGDIQPVNRKDVASGLQQSDAGGDREFLKDHSLHVVVRSRRKGIPGQNIRRVCAGDLPTVEIGHKTIVISHPQRQRVQPIWIGHIKCNPHKDRTLSLIHWLPCIAADVGFVTSSGLKTNRRRGVGPSRIIERLGPPGPAGIQRTLERNQYPGGRNFWNQGHDVLSRDGCRQDLRMIMDFVQDDVRAELDHIGPTERRSLFKTPGVRAVRIPPSEPVRHRRGVRNTVISLPEHQQITFAGAPLEIVDDDYVKLTGLESRLRQRTQR